MKKASEQQQQPTSIKDAKVLMVGAGGIGCALPKNLALSGFQDIHKDAKVLMVGAGGIGCALPKTLALSGFHNDAKVLMVGAGGIGCALPKTLALSGSSSRAEKWLNVWKELKEFGIVLLFEIADEIITKEEEPARTRKPLDFDMIKEDEIRKSENQRISEIQKTEKILEKERMIYIKQNQQETQEQPTAIKDAKVLMVGAGGIGCALPKTLALSRFQDIRNVTVHVKGRTECYPKPAQRTYPVCTITNTPSKFIHCIVWAKGLHFAKLFGDNKNQVNDLNVRSGDASSSESTDDVFERRTGEDFERRIFAQH